MSTIEALENFISSAERSRHYPPNTANAYKNALRLFAKEMTDEEAESIDTLRSNLDKIAQEVFRKNSTKISSASLGTYHRRIKNLLSDYDAYGVNPTKMYEWKRPSRRSSSPISNKVNKDKGKPGIAVDMPTDVAPAISSNRYELTLRPGGIKAVILTPSDLTLEEANRLKSLLDAVSI